MHINCRNLEGENLSLLDGRKNGIIDLINEDKYLPHLSCLPVCDAISK